ncbi:DUF2183 domain-containing protein [Bartonella sp. HY329]|uniref:phosphatidate phosphatase App1 family protein n=1 Tax=unclassified Bartonella TaxID=2645622 RepID=UPI0021C59F8D|nr:MULTISPECIES: phosphatase domain-containing protein [unclassified Bartonella]UXM95361.1 DUF2183 domain-containing protein [Bartonella sp. HY329]UXN09686.1 DUF2183 domain-containing protein [Bartonella sp. HY328]
MTDLGIQQKRRMRGVDSPAFRKLILTVGFIVPMIGAATANPLLKSDEYVMFLPDIAYEQSDGKYVAGVQAWVYEKQRRPGLSQMLALFLGIDLSSLTPAERQRFYERTQLFRVDSERGKQILITDIAGNRHSLPMTKRSGRTGDVVAIEPPQPFGNQNQKIFFELNGRGKPANHNQATAYFAPKSGLSIISDIDDTIKETKVGKTRQVLIKTFLEEFVAVDGMSDWYSDLASDRNVAFHYVSSSPIQLYPLLSEFMNKAGYPEGSMHLRETTRWTEIVPRGAARLHKPSSIDRLVKAYPNRHFILIGDSGEHDPTIYADFMRKYPSQIIGICIRDVSAERAGKNYAEIFAGLPAEQWLVTNSVEKMRSAVNQWRKTNGY